jgi:hypothetical protein
MQKIPMTNLHQVSLKCVCFYLLEIKQLHLVCIAPQISITSYLPFGNENSVPQLLTSKAI